MALIKLQNPVPGRKHSRPKHLDLQKFSSRVMLRKEEQFGDEKNGMAK